MFFFGFSFHFLEILEQLLCKMNYVVHKLNSIEEKINMKQQDCVELTENSTFTSFPFLELDDLSEFDKKLTDEQQFKNLVRVSH